MALWSCTVVYVLAYNVYDEENIITPSCVFSHGDAMVVQPLEYMNPESLSIVCAKLKEHYVVSETGQDERT